MDNWLRYAIENSLGESPSVLLAIVITALLFGSLLKTQISNIVLRSLTYSFIGIVAGIYSYSVFAIPERSIYFLEALSLVFFIALYSFSIVYSVVWVKNKRSIKK